ncbi:sensor histidine kinase [Sphingobacterium sp. UBA1498]|uniref:sensor histidine kinase n=1 Tax=Sphingobacterium sp. UBA1498 TaxID=1947481 RepID=UPI0025EB58E8|nr:histidine kinase [Sphingobacterium sp. UBA1498]
MSALNRILPWLSICLLFIACTKKKGTYSPERKALAAQIQSLEDQKMNGANGDSLKQVWLELDQNLNVKKDTVLAARVKYYLARQYARSRQDSALFFVEKALELIEPTTGNAKYKALIYNGIGNIRSLEAKEREAGYYYNKAATIVLSDTASGLSNEAKSAILLSAAQNNLTSFQYNLAEKMNRAALPLVDALPEGHINRQRVLVQIIQTLNTLQRPAAEIAPYLHKLEELHAKHPDKYNISFLYDSKIQYYETAKKTDSILHYELRKIAIDEYLHQQTSSPTLMNNLFVDYSNVAAIYVTLNKPALGEKFIQKANRLKAQFPKLIFPANEITFQNNLAALYSLQGKNKASIDVLNHLVQLQRSIYQSENTQAIAEMNALYQLQAKDQSIRMLNENIEINKLQLQQNRLWLMTTSLAIILLIIILFFLYSSFRQRRSRQEKEKVLLQQQLLRTQMEPHFIFNTLSAVQSFMRLDKKEDAIKYLNLFSRLLRSNLELSRENVVPLSEELEALENYLILQQMRFDDTFHYHITPPQDQDLSAVMLPPMLIQPYVENAILHGIDLHIGNGSIDIQFALSGDILRVKIQDSGKINSDIPELSHRSLSGAICRERMQLLGKKASIQINKNPNAGTTVILHIPVTY